MVDVFYVKDVFGLKISQPSKIRQIQRRMAGALADEPATQATLEQARAASGGG